MSKIILEEQAAPDTPASGKVAIYPKTDGLLYQKDDAGRETLLAAMVSAENTDVDSAAPEVVDSFADTAYDGVMWVYSIKNGANLRTGQVIAAWDATGDTIQYSEMRTNDVGDTSGVTLSVDISSNTVRLLATVTTDDWSVKALRMAL